MARVSVSLARVALAAAAALLLALPALAAASQPQPVQVNLALQPQPDGGLQLVARVTATSGRPLGMRTVEFYLIPDFFGGSSTYTVRHPVKLVEARTNVAGVARIRWRPALAGPVQLQVRVPGDALWQEAQAEQVVQVQPPAPAEGADPAALQGYPEPAVPLMAARRALGVAAAAVTMAVWGLLAVLLATTLSAIRRAGRPALQRPGPLAPRELSSVSPAARDS